MEYRQQIEHGLRFVIIFCVLLGIVLINSQANAAASYGFFKNPNHPGKCFINESMILSPGDVIYYDTCTKLECKSKEGEVYIVSCGVYGVPPNCTIFFTHADEDYPECCRVDFKCDHDNELDAPKTKHDEDDTKASAPSASDDTITI